MHARPEGKRTCAGGGGVISGGSCQAISAAARAAGWGMLRCSLRSAGCVCVAAIAEHVQGGGMSTQLVITAARPAVAPLLLVNAVWSELTVCMYIGMVQSQWIIMATDPDYRQQAFGSDVMPSLQVWATFLLLCHHVWTSYPKNKRFLCFRPLERVHLVCSGYGVVGMAADVNSMSPAWLYRACSTAAGCHRDVRPSLLTREVCALD
jgi:hypothetical protein